MSETDTHQVVDGKNIQRENTYMKMSKTDTYDVFHGVLEKNKESESISSRDIIPDQSEVPQQQKQSRSKPCKEEEVQGDGVEYENVGRRSYVCSAIETGLTLTDEANIYATVPPVTDVIYKLRDINRKMVDSWQEAFKSNPSRVQVSFGDIFKGAPQADAVVSPANSFGFMDGGIDMVYSRHFGWQMQERLQALIQQEYNGEILVGQAAIIPAFPEGTPEKDMCRAGCNENKPIKYLISAPTMRVPLNIVDTVNAYLAFRGIILAVRKHNENPANKDSQIRSVLSPGLGTAVGKMPAHRCAKQMLEAFTAYELGLKPGLIKPRDLGTVWTHHTDITKC